MGGTKTKPICQKAGDIKLTPTVFEADMGEWVVRIESYDINGKTGNWYITTGTLTDRFYWRAGTWGDLPYPEAFGWTEIPAELVRIKEKGKP